MFKVTELQLQNDYDHQRHRKKSRFIESNIYIVVRTTWKSYTHQYMFLHTLRRSFFSQLFPQQKISATEKRSDLHGSGGKRKGLTPRFHKFQPSSPPLSRDLNETKTRNFNAAIFGEILVIFNEKIGNHINLAVN